MDYFGKIPPEMWEEFKQQKNTPKAKVWSKQNTAKAMKTTENPHHLGAGGYAAKIAKWRREQEEGRRAGLLDMFAGLDQRSRNWVLARILTVTPNGKTPPPEYTWVQVVTMLDESCKINIPTNEGIEVLDDAMN
uniref:Uncharacterized protein n=1 Tax=Setaria italica TaxID=4555 RepID=K3Y1X2_SETIT